MCGGGALCAEWAPWGPQVDSHEKALARGRQEMVFLLGQLDIARELDVVEPAHRLYNLALNKNFTRGRRTNQVLAAPCTCPIHLHASSFL